MPQYEPLQTFLQALALCALTAALTAPPVVAQDAADHSATEKLGKGVAGIAFGWLEIPGQMWTRTREHGVASGLTVGLAEGIGQFVTRELVGVYQFVTAPIAKPEGLDTAMTNPYPWGHFDELIASVFGDEEDEDYLARQEQELVYIRGIEIERREASLLVRFPDDLLFTVGSSELGTDARLRLVGLAETLQSYPDTKLLVRGYTDSTGSRQRNMVISSARATSVSDYLVEKGLPAERVSPLGFGEADPVASNDSEQGRRLNRRVELELIAADVAAGTL